MQMAKRPKWPSKKATRSAAAPKQLSLFEDLPRSPITPKPQAEARRPTRQASTSRTALAVKPIVLTPAQAAAVLCVKPSTLKSWRAKGVGPDYVKRGVRLIGYLPAALDAYLRKSGGRKA